MMLSLHCVCLTGYKIHKAKARIPFTVPWCELKIQ
jgi:hypothetical protein